MDHVKCRPAAQFCCGCSVSFGVKLILVGHLIICVQNVLVNFCKIVLQMPQLGYPSQNYRQDVILMGFTLAGIPIIAMALWAVIHRIEAPVRLYLGYMVATCLLDMYWVTEAVFQPCSNMPQMMKQQGQAFTCGVLEGASVAIIFMSFAIQFYLVYIVFSHCEDLAEGGAGYTLEDLHHSTGHLATTRYRKKQSDAAYLAAGAPGYFEDADGVLDHCAAGYSTFHGHSSDGLGGSFPIFGRFHELDYPPQGIHKKGQEMI